jgi:hexulose-6-phosphate isomerase
MALDWDPFKVKDIKLYADSIGLDISSFAIGLGWKYPLITRDADMYKKAKDILQTGLRFAGILETDCVLSVPGTVNPDMPYDEAYERGVAAYKDCGKMAEEYGVTIGVENVWNKFLLSPLEAARFIDEIGHPWVQFFFDAGNVLLFGYPEQWIRILGKRIAKLHLKEFSRKKRDKEGLWKGFEVALLEGDNDWPAIMKAVDEIGYTSWGIAEQSGGNTPEGLRDLAQRMDRIFAS